MSGKNRLDLSPPTSPHPNYSRSVQTSCEINICANPPLTSPGFPHQGHRSSLLNLSLNASSSRVKEDKCEQAKECSQLGNRAQNGRRCQRGIGNMFSERAGTNGHVTSRTSKRVSE